MGDASLEPNSPEFGRTWAHALHESKEPPGTYPVSDGGRDEALSFDTYQEGASTTALYPGQGGFIGLVYAVLGLNGEAGEAGEQVKKMWRDDAADIQAKVYEAVDELQHGLKGGILSYDVLIERLRDRVGAAFKPEITDERRSKIAKELGDTLWYAAQVASELGLSLSEIADANLIKLARRRAENKLHGEGSDR